MSNRRPHCVILCEDGQQFNFARRTLERFGWTRRDFSENKSPRGRGAGEHYVRENYAKELITLRASLNQGRRCCLVVVLDADTHSVEDRLRLLLQELERSHVPDRVDEPLALFIPRRNIETWLWHLDHGERRAVDESTDYKSKFPGLVSALEEAREFADGYRRQAEEILPSLSLAQSELSRIL